MLDLDETLVHSSLEDVGPPPDFSFTVTFNQRDHNVQVRSDSPWALGPLPFQLG